MPMIYNEDTGQLEFVSDGVYSGPASQGNSIQGNFGDDPNNALRAKGYLPYGGWTGDMVNWQNMEGANGQQFNSELDYLKWLYGDGGSLTDYNGEQYYQTPNGADAYLPGRSPLVNNSPDSKLGQLTLAGLLALGGAGLTGALPGTESVFSGLGGAAGSGGTMTGAFGVGNTAAGATGLGAEFGTAALGLTPAATGLGAEFGTAALGLTPSATAATVGAGAGVPDFANYITNGGATPPTIPGGYAGNGVGLTEAAQAGSTAASGTALSRIMDGTATSADWLSVLGNVGATGLGLAGANSTQNDYNDIANRMLNEGQWARDAFKGTFAPGYSQANQPDFMNALNIGADAAARATSAKSGNPVDNPGAYAEMQKYISGSLALPQLNTTRSQLINAGGMGFDAAGQAQGAAAQAGGGAFNALGYGLGQLTQPADPFKGLLDSWKQNLNTGRGW